MYLNTLNHRLPKAPPGKTGWPWEPVSEAIPARSEDLPVISLVTPCLNGGEFIEEAIRSVLLQGYEKLEYVIVDGGSTDATVGIIEKYQDYLSFWVSEPDGGQSAAINKGMNRCSGEIVNWLNCDDILLPGALHKIGAAYALHPGTCILSKVENLYLPSGRREIIDQSALLSDTVRFWRGPKTFHQPGVFLTNSIWQDVGGLDEQLQICMDYDLYCRIENKVRYATVDEVTVEFKVHCDAKTVRLEDSLVLERSLVSKRYWKIRGLSPRDSALHDRKVASDIGRRIGKRRLPLSASYSTMKDLCNKLNVPLVRALIWFLYWRLRVAIFRI